MDRWTGPGNCSIKKIVMLWEKKSDLCNLGMMGDQLCRGYTNHLVYCGEQVKLDESGYVDVKIFWQLKEKYSPFKQKFCKTILLHD